jgi:iron complex outermembrane receptor protein
MSLRLTAQIQHEEITALPITTISDLLCYLPGLDVRSRGTSSAQTDVSLYGGTFDQVLVLLNGVPVSDVQTGHYSLNLPISTKLIERIEILQGTSAHRRRAHCRDNRR